MLTMTTSWWELALRAAIIYVALLVMVRLSGMRTVGQFTPFDLLVILLLSEGVSNALPEVRGSGKWSRAARS